MATLRDHPHAAEFISPMQCLAVVQLPQGAEWTWELKLDGYRALAVKRGRRVQLYSRNHNLLSDRFPGVPAALEELGGDFVIDGEVVALDPDGRPSFQLLQNARRGAAPIFFYGFDLLHRGRRRLIRLPIEERRHELAELMAKVREPIRATPPLTGSTDAILSAVRTLRLEGVVGKRLGSLYEPGKRSGAWIKHRTNQGQEFVIGGFVPGSRGFDALLVGYYENGHLLYAGKVRNGFPPRIRDLVFPQLQDVRSSSCPFSNLPESGRQRWGEALTEAKMEECRWLQPVRVCQVEFVEWTGSGKLRHPVFVAMRDDKPAASVVREVPTS